MITEFYSQVLPQAVSKAAPGGMAVLADKDAEEMARLFAAWSGALGVVGLVLGWLLCHWLTRRRYLLVDRREIEAGTDRLLRDVQREAGR